MATSTAQQGFPIPEYADDPDVVDDVTKLANAIERRVAGVYTTIADRDAKVSSPEEGQVAVVKDVNRVYVFFDSAWAQIYPPTGDEGLLPTIHKGVAVPDNSLGSDGDIYFRY